MKLLNNIRFAWKLGVMVTSALLGLLIFAALATLTLNKVRISSPLYNDIALAYQLAGDCYDPPASLVAALPPAIAAEDSTDPVETKKYVDILRAAHQAFDASQQHYNQVLASGPIRQVLHERAYPPGEAWFTIAEQQYIPALLSGDHVQARRIRIEKMNPLFTQHKIANDKLSELTASWIPSQETNAGAVIHSRSIELALLFLLISSIVAVLGIAISRNILVPINGMLKSLRSMAAGDLCPTFKYDSRDEMGQVATALSLTNASFQRVLSSIHTAAEQSAAASTQLATTAEVTAERSRHQAQEIQQVATAMVEMSAAISEVSNAASQAATSGSATQAAAHQGHRVVSETMEAIQRAASTTSEAAEHIEKLGQNSETIGSVVSVIEEIASQTNLLALNAAIEAARAGEHGRGFAVVAGEVRRLAERTTKATQEISSMIQLVQQETIAAVGSVERGRSDVEAGLARASQCSAALDEIVRLAQRSEGMIVQIASSAGQQIAVADQVTRSMHSVSEFTTHATAAGEESVIACNGLAHLAMELEHQLQTFSTAANCHESSEPGTDLKAARSDDSRKEPADSNPGGVGPSGKSSLRRLAHPGRKSPIA